MSRVVCWFSCGDASAVACGLALKKYADRDIVVARIVIGSEHPDNDRFAADCARWYGREIVQLRNPEYADTWEVWEDKKYIAGIAGAPCTGQLKKAVRFAFQRPDDVHIWGYTVDEAKRVADFRANNFEITSEFPLVDGGLTKSDCHALVRGAGIELPTMYLLGFNNNNCIACPKGGAGYWNQIRIHFPADFVRMCELSRRLGVRLIKDGKRRIFLDELRPDAGRHRQDDTDMDCSALCEVAAAHLPTGLGGDGGTDEHWNSR